MKKAIAMKWIKALRSGKYKQARGALTKVGASPERDKHCCLGVLCELAIKDGIKISTKFSRKYSAIDYPLLIKVYNGSDGDLPFAVQTWAGIQSSVCAYNIKEVKNNFQDSTSLANKNDAGASFKQIADIIEKNFKTL